MSISGAETGRIDEGSYWAYQAAVNGAARTVLDVCDLIESQGLTGNDLLVPELRAAARDIQSAMALFATERMMLVAIGLRPEDAIEDYDPARHVWNPPIESEGQ